MSRQALSILVVTALALSAAGAQAAPRVGPPGANRRASAESLPTINTVCRRGNRSDSCHAVRPLPGRGYFRCAGRPRAGAAYLLTVSGLVNLTPRAACDVWVAAGGGQRFVRCHGRPFHAGSYSFVIHHRFRGWHITEARRQPLRFSRGRMSFLAGGQDEPPYPC